MTDCRSSGFRKRIRVSPIAQVTDTLALHSRPHPHKSWLTALESLPEFIVICEMPIPFIAFVLQPPRQLGSTCQSVAVCRRHVVKILILKASSAMLRNRRALPTGNTRVSGKPRQLKGGILLAAILSPRSTRVMHVLMRHQNMRFSAISSHAGLPVLRTAFIAAGERP